MIRFFVLTGLIGGLVVAYLTTMAIGPITQLPPPESLLTKFRAEGFVPENPNLEEDETGEDLGVFEVPEEDEAQLEVAQAAFDEMMGGMDMGGMDMTATDGATMDMTATDGGTMDMADSDGGEMDMSSSDSGGDSAAMDMTATDGAAMDMAAADGGTMDMADSDTATEGAAMDMAAADGATMDMTATDGGTMDMALGSMEMGEGGLLVTDDGAFDREIELTMSEWKFSEMMLDVKAGETIKLTVKNGGQIPHEFMFMSPPLMQAVNYRATRADWSLFEHEALYEKALVLPGGEFSFVLQVQAPGSWMFMCMLPYHMQMGMMGQMATQGMAMDM